MKFKIEKDVVTNQILNSEKSLEQISRESKISASTFNRALNCRRAVSLNVARRFSNYFGRESISPTP